MVPKCPRSELLLEFTTLRPVRPGWCIYRYGLVIGRISYESRDRLMGVHYALGRERIVSKLAIPGSYWTGLYELFVRVYMTVCDCHWWTTRSGTGGRLLSVSGPTVGPVMSYCKLISGSPAVPSHIHIKCNHEIYCIARLKWYYYIKILVSVCTWSWIFG